MDVKIVIPARIQSTRLPRKPLVSIAGKPMVVRTFERCVSVMPADRIFVATDSAEIADVCAAHGIATVMTRDDHATGTDRVAEVAQILGGDVFVNVQGDEPVFNPEDLTKLLAAVAGDPHSIINGYCPIHDAQEHASRMVPKVVFDTEGRLLYMSRAPIPGGKSGEFRFGYRQVCAYAFPATALARLRAHPTKTPLEEAEDIEILRFLELGVPVRMIEMSDKSIPVDLPEDVARAEAALAG
ncbi:3-deoxy-manno-octulosonate cytidylyltransferase [Sphingomonas sp. CJ99]